MKIEQITDQCVDKWRAYNATCGLWGNIKHIPSVTPEQFALVYSFVKSEDEFYELAKEIRKGQ